MQKNASKKLKIKELKKISVRKDREIVGLEEENEKIHGLIDEAKAEGLQQI